MKMSLVVDGLRSDVVAVGELGDDAVAGAAERIAAVLGRSVPGRILDLLSDAVAELSDELPEGRVEIRIAGDDLHLAYVEDEPVPGDGGGEGDLGTMSSASARASRPGWRRARSRGRLGERVHRAHARARDIGTTEPG